jgi:diacylglycerol kinase (ATP)
MLRTQRNAQIHVTAAAFVIAAGCWLRISRMEWCAVTLACGMVIGAEALNSAIEKLADAITTEKDERIRHAKDVAAAGVLVASIAALIVGLLVFIPHMMSRL